MPPAVTHPHPGLVEGLFVVPGDGCAAGSEGRASSSGEHCEDVKRTRPRNPFEKVKEQENTAPWWTIAALTGTRRSVCIREHCRMLQIGRRNLLEAAKPNRE